MYLKNIRHDLDPLLVAEQIEKAIAEHERFRVELIQRELKNLEEYEQAKLDGSASRWLRVPEGPAWVDSWIDESIRNEREYYSKVRVIELPQNGKRFILVYGDADDETVTSGTGPSVSFQRAADWFLNGGR